MGASCGGDIIDETSNTAESFHNVGLEAQHAYSVLDVQQVNEHRFVLTFRRFLCATSLMMVSYSFQRIKLM